MRRRDGNWHDGPHLAQMRRTEFDMAGDLDADGSYARPLKAAWNLFSDYSSNSTIHGIKYLGEKHRPLAEKIWWIIACLISLIGCGIFILNIYRKWDTSPVIVSFAEKSTPVWQIPFPAVTFCPETKALQYKFNFTDMYHRMVNATEEQYYNMTDEQRDQMAAVAQVCDAHLLDGLPIGFNTSSSECVEHLRRLSPPFMETAFVCKWKNILQNCTSLFSEVITEEGICYTFNGLNSDEIFRENTVHDEYEYVSEKRSSSSEWTLEGGYKENATSSTYPLRVLGAGARAGLFILLRSHKQDLDYLCRGPVQGFKILLHTPGEMPQVSKQYFRVPLNQEVIVSIKPNMITTAEALRVYEYDRRQCFFKNERRLRFFKIYTQQNCELECLTNYTLRACDCVKFSQPRDQSTPICGATMIDCYNKAEDMLLEQEMIDGLNKSRNGRTNCDCLPSCTSIAYDAEISQADFDWERLLMAYNNPLDEIPGLQLARLTIFFKEAQFITSKRSELYGKSDFIASCGGLLGLFMGFSLLSFVEIIYFCTIRLGSNIRMRRHIRCASIAHSPAPDIKIFKPIDDQL